MQETIMLILSCCFFTTNLSNGVSVCVKFESNSAIKEKYVAWNYS
jgi:hypothetical protein